MTKRLVIVESPTKASKIASYLGEGYVVDSSRGHVRDLPNRASEVPAKYRGEKWATNGVNVDQDFTPIYVVSTDKKATIKKLKSELADADELFLATDGDREGEAIAWHLLEELKPKVPVRRMVFHEITKKAIEQAVNEPRDLDYDLVDAQETRRILDRLYGYEVSPVLWRKVMPKLSAGRVQSVATRLVVDRERERIAFIPASYCDLSCIIDAGPDAEPRQFPARLTELEGVKVATGRDFDSSGNLTSADTIVLTESDATKLAAALTSGNVTVKSVTSKPYVRRPYAPFRTTTLQQEAGRKLRMSSQVTMMVAQELYEGGYITYMRTDSVTLAAEAVSAARAQVKELFGEKYLSDQPRVYTNKVKNAQEAHEAIRPAGDTFRTPAQTGLTGDQLRLYELIWKRTLASQMADAHGESMTVSLAATFDPVSLDPNTCTASASLKQAATKPASATCMQLTARGRTLVFAGFLKAYVESLDEGESTDDDQVRLPVLREGLALDVASAEAESHETRPPSRYTEPTLVAKLEELEIGRPSTYASIIRTLLNRDYSYKRGSALVPTWLAFAVTRLLEKHFPKLVDYEFTASMESALDEIAQGNRSRVEMLTSFYFGDGDMAAGVSKEGLEKLVGDISQIDARDLSTFWIGDSGIAVRVGKFGAYLEDGDGRRANVPDDLAPDELTADKARELLAANESDGRKLGVDPATNTTIVVKNGRFGPFVTELIDDDAKTKPRTASLFKSMTMDSVTLEQALQLLSLPRTIGAGSDGVEITAQNGRFGPYLKKGSESRSLGSEEELFTVTVEQAEALFAQEKTRGRRASTQPLREIGVDPVTGKNLVIKDGRFGPYITDGEYNVTVPRTSSPEAITLEEAADLLVAKRAKGPAKRTSRKSSTKTKKTTAKSAKSAKKSTSKTASAKSTKKKAE